MLATKEQMVDIREGLFQTKVMVVGSGPPVVLLHGAPWVAWDKFLEDLSNHFTVYAPLHPGVGNPDDIHHINTLWELVLYHYELFDGLGLKAPAVIGHSFGGMVAAEVAATNPERVSKLVLIDPVGFWRDDHPVKDWMAIEADELAKASFYDPKGEVAQSFTAVPEDLDAKLDQNIQRTWALACTGKFIWPIPDKGLKHRIHRITAPTLILWGRNDGITDPVYAQEFADRIKKAPVRVEIIDEAAHVPHLEQRAKVVELIRQFLQA